MHADESTSILKRDVLGRLTVSRAKTATLHIASNDSGETHFDLVLNGTGEPSISTWRQLHFGSNANSGNGAGLNDYDNKDGILNLLEYATGMNPKANDIVTAAASNTSGEIEFIYTINKAATDLIYTVEWSDTLNANDWSTTGVSAPSILSDNGATQQIKVTVPVGSGVMRRFVRLKVTTLQRENRSTASLRERMSFFLRGADNSGESRSHFARIAQW